MQPIGEDLHTPWKAAARRSAECGQVQQQLISAIDDDAVADFIQGDFRRKALADLSAMASRK